MVHVIYYNTLAWFSLVRRYRWNAGQLVPHSDSLIKGKNNTTLQNRSPQSHRDTGFPSRTLTPTVGHESLLPRKQTLRTSFLSSIFFFFFWICKLEQTLNPASGRSKAAPGRAAQRIPHYTTCPLQQLPKPEALRKHLFRCYCCLPCSKILVDPSNHTSKGSSRAEMQAFKCRTCQIPVSGSLTYRNTPTQHSKHAGHFNQF